MFMLSINARAYESTFSVTIPKEIVLDGDKKTATYSVDVKGNIGTGETAIVSVTPSTSFSLSNIVANGYPTKEAISAQVSQNVTSWTYNDIMKGVTTSGKITANDISAGDWSGSLNFNVKFDVNSMVVNVTNGEATYDGNAINGGAKVEVVSPSNGYTITYGTTNGTYDLDEMPTYTNPGTYEVYYKIEASNYTTKTGSLTITINEGLDGYTWDEVSAICAKGEAKEYFNVGDETIINLGELPNAEYPTPIQIATIVVGDITNTSLTLLVTSYSAWAPTHVMNATSTNSGGWASTSMRTWLNDEYYKALSNDLQNAITKHISSYSTTYDATNVSYCEDKLWLLSSKEVFGGEEQTIAGETTTYFENLATFNSETQLAYFVNGGNRIRYKPDTNACSWWLRSSYYGSRYCFTDITREDSSGKPYADFNYFVFPAFTIGQPSLNDYSWSEIQAICKAGLANEYFNVGDTKTIDIDALPSASNTPDAQEATLAIGDISSDGTTMTMLVTNYSIEAPTYIMNTTNTNVGGWASSNMRTWLNDKYYKALSSDLQNAIIDHSSSYSEIYDATNVSYCIDKIWLLSSREVLGGNYQESYNDNKSNTLYENIAAYNAETRMAYFANGGDKLRYVSQSSSISCWWWLRSSYSGSSYGFPGIHSNGGINIIFVGNTTNYVFPAFDIG
jgi:hypothetical protein